MSLKYDITNCFICNNSISNRYRYYDGFQCKKCECNCFIINNKINKLSFYVKNLNIRIIIDYNGNKTIIRNYNNNCLIKELNEIIYFSSLEDLYQKMKVIMLFV